MQFDRETLNNQLIKSFMVEGDPGEKGRQGQVKYIVPVIVLAIVGFVTYGWYTDKFAISNSDTSDIPLVRADKEPVRVKPKDPGGMQVANRDKAVYETISNSKQRQELPKVTRILPGPENPVERSHIADGAQPSVAQLLDDMSQTMPSGSLSDLAPASGLNQAEVMQVAGLGDEIQQRGIVGLENGVPDGAILVDEEMLKELIKREKEKILKRIQEERKRQSQQDGTPDIELIKEEKEETKTEHLEPEAMRVDPAMNVAMLDHDGVKDMTVDDFKRIPIPRMRDKAILAPKKALKEAYRVQLGSYKTQTDVAINWRRMRMRHGELLDGLSYQTEKADLGKRGIFYRLKVGPFEKEAQARKLCQRLREKKQACLFVLK